MRVHACLTIKYFSRDYINLIRKNGTWKAPRFCVIRMFTPLTWNNNTNTLSLHTTHSNKCLRYFYMHDSKTLKHKYIERNLSLYRHGYLNKYTVRNITEDSNTGLYISVSETWIILLVGWSKSNHHNRNTS